MVSRKVNTELQQLGHASLESFPLYLSKIYRSRVYDLTLSAVNDLVTAAN